MNKNQNQRGAVSLFVVIFAALFFTAVTVGFVMLMLNDQNRSTNTNLSQSALDAANAGVEDAKRVLAKYDDCVERNDNTGTCQTVRDSLSETNDSCDQIKKIIDGGSGERLVKQNENDKALLQAYTCAKVQRNTVDIIGTLRNEGDMDVRPLKTTTGEIPDKVEVSWSTKASGDTLPSFAPGDNPKLLTKSEWNTSKYPSVLRVQTFSYNTANVDINQVDNSNRTVFLYPANGGVPSNVGIDMQIKDSHKPYDHRVPGSEVVTGALEGGGGQAANKPVQIKCSLAVSPGEYVCKATITNFGGGAGTTPYLTVAGFYNNQPTNYQVKMFKNGLATPLKFDGVQPRVDVTARANDVFRRIESRIDPGVGGDIVPTPRAALATGNSLCKDYVVSDSQDSYDPGKGGVNGCPTYANNEITIP